jgi:hypothetical protein
LGRRAAVAAGLCALLVAGIGCGEAGVADDAVVTAYVAAPLCTEAKRELARQQGEAGSVRVRARCLPTVEDRGRLDLAAVGVNARRATEDSTAVGYIEARGAATRFSRPILDSAGIAFIDASSGRTGMARLLDAVRESDPASLREDVRGALNPS